MAAGKLGAIVVGSGFGVLTCSKCLQRVLDAIRTSARDHCLVKVAS